MAQIISPLTYQATQTNTVLASNADFGVVHDGQSTIVSPDPHIAESSPAKVGYPISS